MKINRLFLTMKALLLLNYSMPTTVVIYPVVKRIIRPNDISNKMA